MTEKKVHFSQISECEETSQLNTTVAESSISLNELCTIEELATCSRIMSSGNICRPDTCRKAFEDNVSGEKDEDEFFYKSLKSKIQEDLPLKLEADKAASTKILCRKRKYPFDDCSANLMEKFKMDQTPKKIALQQNLALTPIMPSSNANNSNIIISINNKVEASETPTQVEPEIETITRRENYRNTNIKNTPSNFNVNIVTGSSKATNTLILKVASTISRNIQSAIKNKGAILRTETENVLYCEFGQFTPLHQYSDDE